MVKGIDYSAVLKDLRKRRRELQAAEAAIARIVRQEAAKAPAPRQETADDLHPLVAAGTIRADEFSAMSAPDAVLRLLDLVGSPQSSSEIAAGLQAGGIPSRATNFVGNTSTTVRRLVMDGKLVAGPVRDGVKTWCLVRTGNALGLTL